ncbi:DUF998 domain-containing protein [Streptomyces sp. WMMC500]|uniref:DUF998 domain-containing protein n=1 Tax=Streptomyces sp. WMMC500 TaxID=3015154 RepID=UPI00248D34C5|nr:DUF998 domain-containing protein [Streptomyces sp. WMMC500]WBB58536.1 DUF998 domain-containing protein [Streptomyces sp. WMMC500]
MSTNPDVGGERRWLLWCGVAGSASFILLFLINDVVKPDYDPVRDAVSEAQIGSGGWLQSVNFIVSGLLITASSVAISQAVNRWTGVLVGLVGAGLALAGVFVSDPVPTDHATWHGMIHNVVGTISSAALIAACFVAARWQATPRWRWYSLVAGVAMPVTFVVATGATETLGIWQRLTNVIGWTWLIVLALRAMRASAAGERVHGRGVDVTSVPDGAASRS